MKDSYSKDRLTSLKAQRLAQEIANAPIVFQVSRLMLKYNIFAMLNENKEGLTIEEIVKQTKLSKYAVQVLLESSLTAGTILLKDRKYCISKVGWFLLNDNSIRVNLDFNHDVNYLGMFHLDESIEQGKPEGLKVFGNWPTIYEGLVQLPQQVQKSWFAFDHFYSDQSFQQALEIVFSYPIHTLLDVGGNTGKWAQQCVQYNPNVTVTIMDLPQQIKLMQDTIKGKQGAERINAYPANVLDQSVHFPQGFDGIWMSQFLDCFSEEQVTDILTRAAQSMQDNTRLFIMETCWDRQEYETAAYCIAQTSVYFTAMANGNSKMFHSNDLSQYIQKANLTIEKIYDNLGWGHSIFVCKKQ